MELNLGSSSAVDYTGKTVKDVEKRRKKKMYLLPEDQMERYLTYKVKPIPLSFIEREPAEGARLQKMTEELIVELDRMRREYQATGYITYELEVTDDEQEGEENQVENENHVEEKEKEADPVELENQVQVEEVAVGAPAVVRPPTVVVGRTTRRRFRQGIVKRAGGEYTKII